MRFGSLDDLELLASIRKVPVGWRLIVHGVGEPPDEVRRVWAAERFLRSGYRPIPGRSATSTAVGRANRLTGRGADQKAGGGYRDHNPNGGCLTAQNVTS